MLFVSFILIFLGILDIECAELPREPQFQPEFSCKTEKLVSKRTYLNQEEDNSKYNAVIPTTNDQILRVVNYLVDCHTSINGMDNTDLIAEDLKKLDPGVIIFHEVLDNSLKHLGFETMLDSLGYHHRQTVTGKRRDISSMIASKYQLEGIGQETIGKSGKILATKVNVDGKEIAIIGAGFCYEVVTNKEHLTKIMKFLNDNIFGKYLNYVVGASTLLSNIRSTKELQVKELNESFTAKGASPPKYTDKWGDISDAIFVSEEVIKYLLGSYVFHTTSTINTPIIVDLEINRKDGKST